MSEWIIIVLMMIGSTFSLLASLGLVRMPDFFTRMQAATKSTTLGVGCIMLAVAVYFGQLSVATQALLVIAFLLLTAPVGAHVLCRAAYKAGVPKWPHTVIDELAEPPPPRQRKSP